MLLNWRLAVQQYFPLSYCSFAIPSGYRKLFYIQLVPARFFGSNELDSKGNEFVLFDSTSAAKDVR